MADNSLQTAIADAEKQLTTKISGLPAADKTETPAEESGENTVEVEVEEEGEEEGEENNENELDEAQLDESKRLYLALKDPKTAGPIIAALAAQAGLHLTPTSTKAEVKEVKKNITDAVAEALGPEYAFLAPKLGKAFESALEIQREEHQASLQEIRQSQVERDVTTAYEKLARETKGESKKLEAKMAALSEEIPIGNMTVEKYIRRLYTVATAEGQQTSARQTADRIRKNASNAPERIRSGSAAGTEPKMPDKKLSLNESVNYALKELTKGH